MLFSMQGLIIEAIGLKYVFSMLDSEIINFKVFVSSLKYKDSIESPKKCFRYCSSPIQIPTISSL